MSSNRIVLGSAIIGFLVALVGVLVWFSTGSTDPARNGQDVIGAVPVALWWTGSFFLAVAMIYGILSNRSRGYTSRRATEDATRRNYEAEDKRAAQTGSIDR